MFRVKRLKFFYIFILVTLFFIFSNLNSYIDLLAKTSSNNDIVNEFIGGTKQKLNFGFREQSYPVSYEDPNSSSSPPEYAGFCNTFSDEIFEKLKIYLRQKLENQNLSYIDINHKLSSLKLVKLPVHNFSQGGYYKRFDGITKGSIDIECGTNSIRPDLAEIDFSAPFFQTGVSLLVKKSDLKKVSSNEKDFGELKIGVVSGSTTHDWLKKVKNYQNFIAYKSRTEAISALKENSIEAYASDYIILKGIQDNDKELVKEYGIYPKYLTVEEYGLAIKPRQGQFKSIINATLIDSPKVKNKIQILEDNYTIKSDNKFSENPSFDSLYKILSNPLNTFLLGISISILVLIASFKKTRKMITDVLKKLWEQVLPEIVRLLLRK